MYYDGSLIKLTDGEFKIREGNVDSYLLSNIDESDDIANGYKVQVKVSTYGTTGNDPIWVVDYWRVVANVTEAHDRMSIGAG